MTWIDTIPDDEWHDHPDLDSLFGSVVDRTHGRVDNILAVHSLNPRALAAHNALYVSAMTGTKSLRKVEREFVAYVVSLENRCHY